MPELNDWLKEHGLESLADLLASNDIDLSILPDLTEADLEKLGLSLGHRRKLGKAIAGLRNSPSGAAPIVPAPASPAAAGPSPEAERRQVTVLFSDLVGSTALANALDPEDMSRLIRRYQDACAGAIARFDGYIAKFMGDGVLAYFGYPQAHEDAAERSVRAALALVDAVRHIERPDGLQLETRVGVATGLVVVGDIIGAGASREETIVGETPNLAARLQALAEPNTVLVSESTYHLLGRAFDYEDRGEQTLKGFAKPVPVWRVVRETAIASRFAAARASGLAPFVGRAQEMGLLLDRWRSAQQGEGQVVLLTAEAGMGKSRLTEMLFERLREEPHRRILTQCSPYYSNTAFYPVMRQLEQAAGFVVEDTPARKLDKLDSFLAKTGTPANPTAPLLADLLSLPADGRYPPLDIAPAQRKGATISALVDHLLRISESEPVLFILEDAHWIDPTTQELMTRLVDSIGSASVFAIVTARPEFVSPWAGRDHVASLALSRLGKSQCAEIVAGVVAKFAVAPDVLEEILAKTDGVPLFVEELARTISESQVPNRLAVPATLQDSLMARLDRLGPAKEVAQVAATIGRQFSYALLAAVTQASASELEAALVRLSEAGLVFPQSRAIELSYSFKHALTRDVAYDSLLKARRQQLHERIARTIEERFPALAEVEPEVMAHHFGQAGLAGPASIYSERAGDHAVARSAYAEAGAHFEAALAQAGRLPEGNDRMRRELSVLLKQGPAALIYKGMRNPQVEPIYQRAYDIAKVLDDEHGLFKGLWGLWFCASMARRSALARARADELVVLAQRSDDEVLLLEAIHCRWATAFFDGDVAKSLVDGREGIKRYDAQRHSRLGAEFGGHDAGVCALSVVGLGLAQFGSPRAAAESADRGLALAQTLNQPATMAFAIMNAMTTYQMIGDRDAVMRLVSQMLEVADKFKLPPQRSVAIFKSGWVKAHGDGLAEGLRTMESEFARVTIMGPLPVYHTGLLASVRLEAGQAAKAIELLDPILRAVQEPGVGMYLPEIHRLRGECLLRLGPDKFDEAVLEFETAMDIAKRKQARAFQLRAAISLALAWSSVNSPQEGIASLREIVGAFESDENFPDLATARQMLSASSH